MNHIVVFVLSFTILVLGCDRCGDGNVDCATRNGANILAPGNKLELCSRLERISDMIINKRAGNPLEDGCGLREWICALEAKDERECAIDIMEKWVHSINTRSLPVDTSYNRSRKWSAVRCVFELEMQVAAGMFLLGYSHWDRWKVVLKALQRLLDERDVARIEARREELTEKQKNDSLQFAKLVQYEYETRLQHLERDFVMSGVNDIPPDEYTRIRALFEKFLGRPLRTAGDFEKEREQKINGSRP